MFEREIIGLAGLLIMFLLMAIRIPVGLSMIIIGIGGNWVLSIFHPYLRFEPYLKQFKSLLWSNLSNYDLSIVPLFVLMGYLASHARLSGDLFRGMEAIVGRFRGGVAMAAVGACGAFGAVCGSSLATAATMGKVALPELQRLNYAPRLSMGALAAGGTLGILIPPSVALVVYAIMVEGSIISMFQAAVIPGILAILGFVFVIALQVRINPELAPKGIPMPRDERRAAIRSMLPVSTIFLVIIFGLGLGVFTPTPAASIGVFLILAFGLWRQATRGTGLARDGIRASVLDTATTTGMIFFVLFGAEVLKTFFARAGLPSAVATMVGDSGLDPMLVLVIMLGILIILGCFMESLSMILIVIPFLWPTLVALNGGPYVDAGDSPFGMTSDELKIWFGILTLIVIELGLITPPVGLNVFIIGSMSKGTPIAEAFRGVMPFLAMEFVRVAFILALPILALALPRMLN
ncbi:TRAP transporter large permease [Stappia sp.]|uniref:TRAP transporter large permease n=1 Tax=Stappia sp. TaxID=1870903 RepID=UPI003A99A2CF